MVPQGTYGHPMFHFLGPQLSLPCCPCLCGWAFVWGRGCAFLARVAVKKGEKDITNVHTAALEHESSVTRAAADAQSQYNEQHGRTETIKQRAE